MEKMNIKRCLEKTQHGGKKNKPINCSMSMKTDNKKQATCTLKTLHKSRKKCVTRVEFEEILGTVRI
jgi:hypothetical protein